MNSTDLSDFDDKFYEELPESIKLSILRLRRMLAESKSPYESLQKLKDASETLVHFIGSVYLSVLSQGFLERKLSFDELREISSNLREFSLGKWFYLCNTLSKMLSSKSESFVSEFINNLDSIISSNSDLSAMVEYRNRLAHGQLMESDEGKEQYDRDLESLTSKYKSILKECDFLRKFSLKRDSLISNSLFSATLVSAERSFRLSPLIIWKDNPLLLWRIDFNRQGTEIISLEYIDSWTAEKVSYADPEIIRELEKFANTIDPSLYREILRNSRRASKLEYGSFEEERMKKYITRESLENKILKMLDENHRITLITGDPGSGKTSLMISLACHKSVFRHYFGLYQDPSTAIESLLSQAGFPIRYDLSRTDQFRNFLQNANNRDDIYIFLDGLDEAIGNWRDCLPTDIMQELRNVHFVVSARSGSTVAGELRELSYVRELNIGSVEKEESESAIRALVERNFETCNHSIRKDLVEKIVSNSGNNFLFAEILSKDPSGSNKDLKTALSEWFSRWQKSFSSEHSKNISKNLLVMLSVADEPLTESQLVSFLSLISEENTIEIHSAIDRCREFIDSTSVDGEDAFTVFHDIFREYVKANLKGSLEELFSTLLETLSNWSEIMDMDSSLKILLLRKAPYLLTELAVNKPCSFSPDLLGRAAISMIEEGYYRDRKKYSDYTVNADLLMDSISSVLFLAISLIDQRKIVTEDLRTIISIALKALLTRFNENGLASDYEEVEEEIRKGNVAKALQIIGSSTALQSISGLFALKILKKSYEDDFETLYDTVSCKDSGVMSESLDMLLGSAISKEQMKENPWNDLVLCAFVTLQDEGATASLKFLLGRNRFEALKFLFERFLFRTNFFRGLLEAEEKHSVEISSKTGSKAREQFPPAFAKRLKDMYRDESVSLEAVSPIIHLLLFRSCGNFVGDTLTEIIPELTGNRLLTAQAFIIASGNYDLLKTLSDSGRKEVIRKLLEEMPGSLSRETLLNVLENNDEELTNILISGFVEYVESKGPEGVDSERRSELELDKKLILNFLNGKEYLYRDLVKKVSEIEFAKEELSEEYDNISDEEIERVSELDFDEMWKVYKGLQKEGLEEKKQTLLLKTLEKAIKTFNPTLIRLILMNDKSPELRKIAIRQLEDNLERLLEHRNSLQDTLKKAGYSISLLIMLVDLDLIGEAKKCCDDLMSDIRDCNSWKIFLEFEDLCKALVKLERLDDCYDLLNRINIGTLNYALRIFDAIEDNIEKESMLEYVQIGSDLGSQTCMGILIGLACSKKWSMMNRETSFEMLVDRVMKLDNMSDLQALSEELPELYKRLDEDKLDRLVLAVESAVRSVLNEEIDLSYYQQILDCTVKLRLSVLVEALGNIAERLSCFEGYVLCAEAMHSIGLDDEAEIVLLGCQEDETDSCSEEFLEFFSYYCRGYALHFLLSGGEPDEFWVPLPEYLIEGEYVRSWLTNSCDFQLQKSIVEICMADDQAREKILKIAENPLNDREMQLRASLFCVLSGIDIPAALKVLDTLDLQKLKDGVVEALFYNMIKVGMKSEVHKAIHTAVDHEKCRLSLIFADVLFESGNTAEARTYIGKTFNDPSKVMMLLKSPHKRYKFLEGDPDLAGEIVELSKGLDIDDFNSRLNLAVLKHTAGKRLAAKDLAVKCMPEETKELKLEEAKALGGVLLMTGETEMALSLSVHLREAEDYGELSERELYRDFLASRIIELTVSKTPDEPAKIASEAMKIVDSVSGSKRRLDLLLELNVSLRRKGHRSNDLRKAIVRNLRNYSERQGVFLYIKYLNSLLQDTR